MTQNNAVKRTQHAVTPRGKLHSKMFKVRNCDAKKINK